MKTIDTLDNRPFKRLITTIGALPTSFIDSMSYYEMLAWLCDYLQNTVIPAVDNNAEALKELQDAFVELKEYVDEYFDNLDIQTEIDNKLDEMAESGELAELITQYLDLQGLFGYDTIADMAAAENLQEGSMARTLGKDTYNDGKGAFYKIRALSISDVVDGYNIVSLASGDTIVAERLYDADIQALQADVSEADADMCTAKCGYSYTAQSYYEYVKIPRDGFDMTVIPYSIYGYDGSYKYVNNHPGAFYINGQIVGPTVIDGVVTTDAVPENPTYWYFFGVDTNGDPKYTKDTGRALTGSDLLTAGYQQAIAIWSPVVINGVAFSPSTELDTTDPNYNYIVIDRQPRSLIGYDDDYWYLITVDGRLPRSKGASYTDLVNLMSELNIPNAFNMDGGSSTQLWVSNPTTNLSIIDHSSYARGYTSNNVTSLLKFYKEGE